MIGKVSLRRAVPGGSDVDTYVSMYKSYGTELRQYDPTLPEFTDAFCMQLANLHIRYSTTLFADFLMVDDKIIGFSVGQFVSFKRPFDNYYIVEFYIKPEYRRKGYGLEAVKLILNTYHFDRIFWYVIVGNTPAERFWSKVSKTLGLTPVYAGNIKYEKGCSTWAYMQSKDGQPVGKGKHGK